MENLNSLIKDWNETYIKPLKLKKIVTYIIDNHIKIFDIYEKLKYEGSSAYKNVLKNIKMDENNTKDEKILLNAFIREVIKEWISTYTDANIRLKNNAQMFEMPLSCKSIHEYAIDALKRPKKYLDGKNEEESLKVLKNEILKNEGLDPSLIKSKKELYLKDMGYDNLIKNIKDLGFEDIIKDIDDHINYTFSTNKTYNIDLLKEEYIYLNIMPFQDGNDEGLNLGVYLDYLGTKVKSDNFSYYSYYIQKDKKRVSPQIFTWFMETQGHKPEDIIGINTKDEDIFLKTLAQEILNEQNSNQFLTFLLKVNIVEFFKIIRGQDFTISRYTVCGFSNIVHGSTSGLGIDLKKDITLSITPKNSIIQIEDPNEEEPYGCGYVLSEIWGFDEDSYSDLEKD